MRSAWLRADTMLVRLLAVIVGIACVLAVVACGSGDGGESRGSSNSSELEDGAYPAMIENSYGKVTLEERPSRVVTLSENSFENIVALGETPKLSFVTSDFDKTAAYDTWRDESYIVRGEKVTDGSSYFEKIADARPDLIIAPSWKSFTDEQVSSKLRAIAPTLIYDPGNSGEGWKKELKDTAKLLGKQQESDTLIGKYEERITEVKGKLPSLEGSSFVFAGAMADGTVAVTHSADELLESVGLVQSESQINTEVGRPGTGKYSPENYSKIDADIIFLNPRGVDSATFMDSSAFYVIEDRVVWDDKNWGFAANLGGVIAHTWAPDTLAAALSVR